MLKNRIKKNLARLKGPLGFPSKVNALRLYGSDIPEIPYLIDYYNGLAVISERGIADAPEEKRVQQRETIATALRELLNVKETDLYFKDRGSKSTTATKTAPTRPSLPRYLLPAPLLHTVEENGRLFSIDPASYLDTGLFLDHRPLRDWLMADKLKNGQGQVKKILNLFSYTCSLGVASALAGHLTTNVDTSNTYLQWGKGNYQLNHLPLEAHRFIRQDAREFLEDNREKFDTIILDPPTYSNSKSREQDFDVQRDHPDYLKLCLRALAPEGKLYFSNNLRSFKLDPLLSEKYQIENLTTASIPIDFRDPKIHHCFLLRTK
jgi:23S rRNA G2069 N7-methylase RlmK/C1962 C5-methylase RlmI